jgi:Mg-chelatase subunit ChlD
MRACFSFLSLIFCLCFPYLLSAQVKFDKPDFNFGTLEDWNQHPAEFYFTNTANEKVAILRIDASDEVHARYPANFILPGQKSRIVVYFEPLETGNFNEDINVYTNLSDKPITLNIRGKVKSIIECPSNNNNDYAIPSFKQEGKVLDKSNRNPVPGASIKFIDAQKSVFRARTASRGDFNIQLERGVYTMIIDAPGYNIYAEEIYLNKNSAPLLFLLEKPDINPVADHPEPNITKYDETNQFPVGKNENTNKQPIPKNEETNKTKILNFALEGTVVNLSTKQPVNQAAVNLQNIDTRINYFYLTWRDGKFRKQLKPGIYLVNIVAKNYETYQQTLTITEFTKPITFEITPIILPTETISQKSISSNPLYVVQEGMVVDKTGGQPLANAKIRFIDKYNVSSPYTTFKNGKFKKELQRGPYTVTVKAKNYQNYTQKFYIRNDSNNIIFALEKRLPPIKPETQTVIKSPKDSTSIEQQRKPELILTEEPPIDSVVYIDQVERSNQQIPLNIPVKSVSELDRTVYNANNIVFLIDVSGSMKEFKKMDLLKASMKKLVAILRDIDNVSIITYASKQNVLLSGIQGNKKEELISAIDSLKPHGFTFGMEGLQKAFDQSKQGYVNNGNNQVILVTDGMFNSPNFTEAQVMSLAKKMKAEGIIVSVIGFGKEEEGIKTIKKIAKNGGGNYLLIEDKETSESVLIQEIMNNSKKKLK